MKDQRNSIFNKILSKCEKNKITREICFFIIRIGIGDVIYRAGSKEYLKKRCNFFKNNENRIKRNLEILEDEESKTIYSNLIKYRCQRMRKFFPKIESNRYFVKEIINLDENENFIDCGAFLGDTVEDFKRNCNNSYNKIICFEPDKNNFEMLKENCKNYDNITLYCKGVYSKTCELNFNSTDDEGSSINENGEEKIKVVNLDNVDECKDATFIKMDIEGSELEALKGAEKIIKNNKPKLAICIYHSDMDMIDIIEYIDSLNLNYKLYVRQHSLYEGETVLYCV